MSEQSEILVVHSDPIGSNFLVEELSRIPAVEARVAEKQNLDGSPAGWLVLAVVTIRTLPAILDAVGRLIQLRGVKSIRIGEVEMENPTRADVDDLKNSFLTRRIIPPPQHG